jgi:two-component system phosphate regulon response regulator PhoB
MPRSAVLVVEDDEDISEVVVYHLTQAGYDAYTALSGEEALEQVRTRRPALVLLDLMLPGLDGLDVCRRLKDSPATASIPIIMMTARREEADVVIGLELGADDYVTKPFSPRVLVARVKAALRRRASGVPGADDMVQLGRLVIAPGRHEVWVDGSRVQLTPTEFGVLQMLARKPGWVFTRHQIVDAVRGEDYAVTERAVDVQMVGLRKKLGKAAELVETVRGVGYRLRA